MAFSVVILAPNGVNTAQSFARVKFVFLLLKFSRVARPTRHSSSRTIAGPSAVDAAASHSVGGRQNSIGSGSRTYTITDGSRSTWRPRRATVSWAARTRRRCGGGCGVVSGTRRFAEIRSPVAGTAAVENHPTSIAGTGVLSRCVAVGGFRFRFTVASG